MVFQKNCWRVAFVLAAVAAVCCLPVQQCMNSKLRVVARGDLDKQEPKLVLHWVLRVSTKLQACTRIQFETQWTQNPMIIPMSISRPPPSF